ncbi:MAG: PepSY domain-containing protein [Bdellovibrionales bacterium]|nr:PepSY domain-containing protein [Bdellovibrionales bacterium]
MKIKIRIIHEYLSLITAPYLFIVILTGVFLLVRNDFNFIKPKLKQSSSKEITISHPEVLNSLSLKNWDSISHYRVYPSKGHILVRFKDGQQVQLDGKTGEVLSQGQLMTPLLIKLHEGSFFGGKFGRYFFLLLGLMFLTLFGTGVYLLTKSKIFSKRSC